MTDQVTNTVNIQEEIVQESSPETKPFPFDNIDEIMRCEKIPSMDKTHIILDLKELERNVGETKKVYASVAWGGDYHLIRLNKDRTIKYFGFLCSACRGSKESYWTDGIYGSCLECCCIDCKEFNWDCECERCDKCNELESEDHECSPAYILQSVNSSDGASSPDVISHE